MQPQAEYGPKLPRGVWLPGPGDFWRCEVRVGKRRVVIGRFQTSQEAYAALVRATALRDERVAAEQPLTASELRGEARYGPDLLCPNRWHGRLEPLENETMAIDLMERPGRKVELAALGLTVAELRDGDSRASIKSGYVKRVFWFSFDGEEHRAHAVVSHERWLPDAHSAMPEGAEAYRLQLLVDPREWRKPSWSRTATGWGARLARGEYEGLETQDELGRDWVMGHDWFRVEVAQAGYRPCCHRPAVNVATDPT